jgi:predicted extracellular nuclease
MSFRIATFNVENLMSRFDFEGVRSAHRRDRATRLFDIDDAERLRAIEQARMIASTDDTRQLTALAIADCFPDILCLQEVENIEALDAFEHGYLFKMVDHGFRQKHVLSGNDRRGINVAIAAREKTANGEPVEIITVTSHREVTYGDFDLLDDDLVARNQHANARIFRRDCLEVDLRIGGKPLTVYVCHFKSMGPNRDGMDGRSYSMPVRRAEAKAVKRIIENRFGDAASRMNWLICGDFNAYQERIELSGPLRGTPDFTFRREAESGIDCLIDDGFSENLIARRPKLDRWTLFHSRGLDERHLCQLDYILASPELAKRNSGAVPEIIRAGQPYRTPMPEEQEVDRYPRTGWDRPKASDHCPVVAELSLP